MRRKTVTIPEDDDGNPEKPARKPRPLIATDVDNKPVVLQRDKDGNPTLIAPPRRFWIRLTGG